MRRATLLGAAILFLAFAAYGSIVPLTFRRMPIREGLSIFLNTPFEPLSQVSRTDFASNILLFVPIGFFALGAAAPRGRLRALGWLLPVFILSTIASTTIEFSQVFFSGRTPSWDDVLAQMVGGLAGAIGWIAVGERTSDWVAGAFGSDSVRDRLLGILAAYVGLWVILSVLPFDFTVRPAELAEKFRAGKIVLKPFADEPGIDKIISSFLFAIPIGAFAFVLAHARRLKPVTLWAVTIGVAAILGREFGQLMALSRTADATDVILGTGGVLLGIVLARRMDRDEQSVGADAGVRLWPVLVLALWLMIVLARHWTPFNFRADGDFVRSRLPVFFQVPFSSYYWGNPLNAFQEVTTKMLLGVPVGGLLQAVYTPRTQAGRRWQLAVILIVSFLVFLTIELGQLLLPTRFPDQTDVYIGTAGGLIGVLAVRLLTRPNRPVAGASSRHSL
jgi:glycopeptide antibiotics resistance protein